MLTPEIEAVLYPFLKNKVEQLHCQWFIGNGVADHVHLLISLAVSQSIANVVKTLKGASSRFLSMKGYEVHWNVGYAVFSVSKVEYKKVYTYIQNQPLHHADNTMHKDWELQ